MQNWSFYNLDLELQLNSNMFDTIIRNWLLCQYPENLFSQFSGSTAWETARKVTSQISIYINIQVGTINLKVIQLLFETF